MRLVPETAHTTSFSHIPDRTPGAPSAPGLHDVLRAGVGPSPHAADKPASAHPLEARLKAWEATRHNLQMETLRRTYGIAEPVRRGMELKIVRDGTWRPLALGGSAKSVHEEILEGRDGTIQWEDIYTGDESRAFVSVQDEMERKVKMGSL